jgi:hypothetical protein
MAELRLLAALALVLTGGYLIYDLFASGFSLMLLVAAIGCLVLAYWIKPRRREEHDWRGIFDVLDLLLEIPFQLMAKGLRLLLRFGKDDIGGIDV